MKPLPVTYNTALLRVDFVDDEVWQRVRDAATRPLTSGSVSHLVVIDDRDFEGLDLTVPASQPDAYEERVLLVFDRLSREHPDHPLLLVDWLAYIDDDDHVTPGAMRVTPEQAQLVEGNLQLANMDFEDYLAYVDAEGVFRGFP